MRARLLLATTAAVSALAVPAAADDLRDRCWENVPSFRLSALACTRVPETR